MYIVSWVHRCIVCMCVCMYVYNHIHTGGDESGSGSITADAVQHVLKEFGMNINVNQLVRDADLDMSG
jgi:hypothetical protein